MKSYEVLETAIPQKASDRVASILNVAAASVRRWRRENESDEAPLSTGQKSILDRFLTFMDAVFVVNPSGVALIMEFANEHYRTLVDTHSVILSDHRDCARQSAEVLKEATDVVNQLNLDGCNARTIVELMELRDAVERTIANVRRTMREENTVC